MREDLIWEVQRMLHERCMYYTKKMKRTLDPELKGMFAGKAGAYQSACDILLAAVEENEEILKEFDYYAK